ncbi:hypothetical protein BLNAU_12815 [Blattamonas nauphoetae]|uniref:Uncharacterized protein n=1 Tax=Blattamonas nauphoetae TaxID=2049346 RepID=A0ABQ9XPV5_9EUKA|nr:hypothetical protein BLNAU_12815 [Blattamonas nauphoetae]
MPTTSPHPRLPAESPQPANSLQMFISPSEMPVPHTSGAFTRFPVRLSNPPNLSQMDTTNATVSPLPERQIEAFNAYVQRQTMSNTQPVRYTGLPENTWEGEPFTGFHPGKYDDFIVTPDRRKLNVVVEVTDSEIGAILLLNRGDPRSHFRFQKCTWLNQYRIAIFRHSILFICEVNNKLFSVQPCFKNAKSFEPSTPATAWEDALRVHYIDRPNSKKYGLRYFGMENEILRSNCPGMRAGPTTPKKRRKLKKARKAKRLDDKDSMDKVPPLQRPGTSAPERSQTEGRKQSQADHQIPKPDDLLIANQQRQNMLDDQEIQPSFPQKPFPWEVDVDREFDSENGL